ncbi:tetratricopeptide repeat protein [Roseovarius salinarum]|uniref:tetratricopeptide repeat protein n=1 Tax=Roseovarius salinarum TaxID=1981892 RepID=UPI000C320F21|nr:tetratricopeptide repeat protein [Roseovarius salinarum]
MARRFAAVLSAAAALAACDAAPAPPDKSGPFAPGVARSGQTVDPMVVGHRLVRAGEHEAALDAFERAAVDRGMTHDVLTAMGSANIGLGRLGEAERLLRRAIERDDTAPQAWNNLGVVLMEKGETAEAAEVFRRAFALDNGASTAIRDNLRLALEKNENSYYDDDSEQEYKLVRRGSSDFLIRQIP